MKPSRRRAFAILGVAALALVFSSAVLQSPVPEEKTVEAVAPGVEHVAIRRGDFSAPEGKDRWTIHVLRLDPRLVRLELGVAMDEVAGAETVSSLAARRGALAAVNGGYFRTAGTYRGEPAGLLSLNGKVLSEPNAGRSSLAVSNAGEAIRIAAARTTLAAALIVEGGASRPVAGFNRPRGSGELVVYHPEFHRTTLTTPDGLEAAVERGRVVAVRDLSGSTPIPENGLVVSASGEARAWALAHLKPGAGVEVKIDFRADPPFPFEPEFIIGAGPHLIKSGRTVEGEGEVFSEGFYAQRHPRTALGAAADGTIFLVTVDGRQPKTSVGMSIPELAALMVELGGVEAVNLDGGGSTTMVVRGRVANRPSDAAGERPVSDALLVVARRR